MQHLNRVLLPNRDTIIESIKKLRQLVFPGYFGKQGLTSENVGFRIGELVDRAVRHALRAGAMLPAVSRDNCPASDSSGKQCEECDHEAAEIVANFLDRIPAMCANAWRLICRPLSMVIRRRRAPTRRFSRYPGLFAIFVQRTGSRVLQDEGPAAAANHDRICSQPDRHRYPPRREAGARACSSTTARAW